MSLCDVHSESVRLNLHGKFLEKVLIEPGGRGDGPRCACGQRATTRLPSLEDWACLACAILYYTTLVQHGAASYRAGNYAVPHGADRDRAPTERVGPVARFERVCRCGHLFWTHRLQGFVCRDCVTRQTRAAQIQSSGHRKKGPGTAA